MRKIAVPVVGAVAATAVMAVPAIAQAPSTTVTVSPKVSSNKAGTKKKPKAVKLTVKAKFTTSPAGAEKPVVTNATVKFTKGSLYNGGKYPSCSLSKLNRGGPSGCPKGSIMGSGSGNALADTVVTKPKIVVVNGGAKNVYLFTTLTSPARVATAVPGKIKKIGGKYAYQLDLTVPQSLRIVAGIPIALQDVTITAGSTSKDYLATTACPSGNKWPFSLQASFDNGTKSNLVESSVARRK